MTKAVFLNPLEICSVSTKFRQKFLGDDWDLIDGSKKYIELDLDEIIELLTEVSTLRDANAALIKDRDRLILELTALRNRNAQP